MRRSGLSFMFTMLWMLGLFAPVLAQQTKEYPSGDTTARIGALADFHEVIFKIWHTAWPNKDTAMLRALLPDVQRYADSLRRTPLPGILRDKRKAWEDNVAQLLIVVGEYKSASSAAENQKLLDAAERLHAQYEKLVRITKPVLKELDEFHHVLYMLYHHYLPENNHEKLVSSVRELKGAMVLLEKAVLPERLKNREAAFSGARVKLSRSVGALDAATAKTNQGNFASAVESVHADYQTLERVFE